MAYRAHKNLIPNSNGTAVAAYDANIYTGQFSAGEERQYLGSTQSK